MLLLLLRQGLLLQLLLLLAHAVVAEMAAGVPVVASGERRGGRGVRDEVGEDCVRDDDANECHCCIRTGGHRM